MKKKWLVVSWIAVVMWMSVIFYLSHQPAEASAELSRGVSDVVFRAIATVFDVDIEAGAGGVGAYEHLLRKIAHGVMYFVLAVLLINALRRSGMVGYKAYVTAFLFCVFYAVTDEVHQLYVPGRSGELGDVMIDSAGALVGLGFYYAGAGMAKMAG